MWFLKKKWEDREERSRGLPAFKSLLGWGPESQVGRRGQQVPAEWSWGSQKPQAGQDGEQSIGSEMARSLTRKCWWAGDGGNSQATRGVGLGVSFPYRLGLKQEKKKLWPKTVS